MEELKEGDLIECIKDIGDIKKGRIFKLDYVRNENDDKWYGFYLVGGDRGFREDVFFKFFEKKQNICIDSASEGYPLDIGNMLIPIKPGRPMCPYCGEARLKRESY